MAETYRYAELSTNHSAPITDPLTVPRRPGSEAVTHGRSGFYGLNPDTHTRQLNCKIERALRALEVPLGAADRSSTSALGGRGSAPTRSRMVSQT